MNLTDRDASELLLLHACFGHGYVISTNGEVWTAKPVDDITTLMTDESAEGLREQLQQRRNAREEAPR